MAIVWWSLCTTITWLSLTTTTILRLLTILPFFCLVIDYHYFCLTPGPGSLAITLPTTVHEWHLMLSFLQCKNELTELEGKDGVYVTGHNTSGPLRTMTDGLSLILWPNITTVTVLPYWQQIGICFGLHSFLGFFRFFQIFRIFLVTKDLYPNQYLAIIYSFALVSTVMVYFFGLHTFFGISWDCIWWYQTSV